jgi:hypothetical protein
MQEEVMKPKAKSALFSFLFGTRNLQHKTYPNKLVKNLYYPTMKTTRQIVLLLLLGHVAAFTPSVSRTGTRNASIAATTRITSGGINKSLTDGTISPGLDLGLGPLYLKPGRSASVINERYVNSDSKNHNKDRTEVSRLKFMINQLKGSAQESEMRAGAAENRVAMLQEQIKKLESAKNKQPKEKDDAPKVDQAILAADMKKDHE